MPHSKQARANWKRKNRRFGGGRTYDGVNDAAIYERDGWECRMPVCLCPDGRRIDPSAVLRDVHHPWKASIDHIVPLAVGGSDDAPNKRAAHLTCNEAAVAGWGPRQRSAGRLSYRIGDVVSQTALNVVTRAPDPQAAGG